MHIHNKNSAHLVRMRSLIWLAGRSRRRRRSALEGTGNLRSAVGKVPSRYPGLREFRLKKTAKNNNTSHALH